MYLWVGVVTCVNIIAPYVYGIINSVARYKKLDQKYIAEIRKLMYSYHLDLLLELQSTYLSKLFLLCINYSFTIADIFNTTF